MDAEKYRAEVRAMTAKTLVKEHDVCAANIQFYTQNGCPGECDHWLQCNGVVTGELLRRLSPGKVDREKLADILLERTLDGQKYSKQVVQLHRMCDESDANFIADLIESNRVPMEEPDGH